MQVIKKIWLAIANFSIDQEKTDFSEKKRIRLINLFMFVICIFQLFYVLFVLIASTSLPENFWLRVASLSLLVSLVYVLHYFRKYMLARFLFITAMSFIIFNNVRSFKGAMSMEYFLFVIAASCFILFDRLRYVVPAFIFVFVVYVMTIHYFGQTYPEVFFVNIGTYIRAGMAFVLLFLLFNLFRNEHEDYQKTIEEKNIELVGKNEEITAQTNNLATKNKEIISSINYARRIQTALLPQKETLQKYLPDLLLYYRPKDIVSGDFYWFSKMNENEVILAVVDCTGHGVPGAFMTVIANNLLDQIINKDQIIAPAQILTELDKRLLQTLQQQGESNERIRDGMDIVLLKIDFERQKLVFAGAGRPVWIFENGKAELTEYKGDKFPIGSNQFKNKLFTEREILLRKKDTIYLFTDGYADQFGKEGKLTTRKFRNLLQGIYQDDFAEQELILQENLQTWKGKEKQTDDILVVGIRV